MAILMSFKAAATDSSDSQPSGHRCCAIALGQLVSISERVMPCQTPAERSRNSTLRFTAPSPITPAMISAVRRARCKSLDAIASKISPRSSSWFAANNACCSPNEVSGGSAWPYQRPSAFHSDWPCRRASISTQTIFPCRYREERSGSTPRVRSRHR